VLVCDACVTADRRSVWFALERAVDAFARIDADLVVDSDAMVPSVACVLDMDVRRHRPIQACRSLRPLLRLVEVRASRLRVQSIVM
jgi:hypothetical protein